MPKQDFSIIDYFGAVCVGIVFILILLFLSLVTSCLFIRKSDEITTFEKLGARLNLRMGPHRMSMVKNALVTEPMAQEEF